MSPPNSTSVRPTGVLVRKPETSIYTVLLGITAAALTIACVVLLLELHQYWGHSLFSWPWLTR